MNFPPNQQDLFSRLNSEGNNAQNNIAPLAHQLRPNDPEFFYGHQEIIEKFRLYDSNNKQSLILWGPPGCGKTTLAYLLAKQRHLTLYPFSAVLGGVADLKKLIQQGQEDKNRKGKNYCLFIDEIHRFNKAQQDALLPYVEEGKFLFIGATTENPRISVNKALLSRIQLIELKGLETGDLRKILLNALEKNKLELKNIHPEVLDFIISRSGGDARKALSGLESCLNEFKKETFNLDRFKSLFLESVRFHDRNGDRHYDVISAFIKSMRGSDPNAALLYLAMMLDGGEDPVFIARRLVIFASEDIGNADPSALNLAVNALHVVMQIGMPEARITLAQATTYLAASVKSNAAYTAINEALTFVKERGNIEIPDQLKNFPPPGSAPYLYPHNYEGGHVRQAYTKDAIPAFYRPKAIGIEERIAKRLSELNK